VSLLIILATFGADSALSWGATYPQSGIPSRLSYELSDPRVIITLSHHRCQCPHTITATDDNSRVCDAGGARTTAEQHQGRENRAVLCTR